MFRKLRFRQKNGFLIKNVYGFIKTSKIIVYLPNRFHHLSSSLLRSRFLQSMQFSQDKKDHSALFNVEKSTPMGQIFEKKKATTTKKLYFQVIFGLLFKIFKKIQICQFFTLNPIFLQRLSPFLSNVITDWTTGTGDFIGIPFRKNSICILFISSE